MNLNEQAAIQLVLSHLTVKELLTYVLKGLSNDESPQAQDNANLCFNAIETFLE